MANSRYATIIEEKGVCYLKIKTAERAHTPKELWETIKLDASYKKAMEQIDKELEYWPNFIKHKCKQRFTRIRQVLVKRKKIRMEGSEEYQIISRKAEKREKTRLVKAEKAAVIENHITEELLNNLKKGKYNEIYNYPLNNFNKVLEKETEGIQQEESIEEDDDNYEKGYIEDFSDEEGEESDEGMNDDDIDDIFNTSTAKTKSTGKQLGKKKQRGKINYEVEKEYENTKKNTHTNEQIDF